MNRVRLVLDFPSEEALLSWVEEARELLFLGSNPDPTVEGVRIPRTDLGVREIDAIDLSKVTMGNTFVVSNRADGGKFLEVEEKTVTEVRRTW